MAWLVYMVMEGVDHGKPRESHQGRPRVMRHVRFVNLETLWAGNWIT